MIKFCSKTGCGELVALGEKYCERHKDLDRQRYKEYNRYRREEERNILNFYCSGPWLRLRDTMYSRHKGMCVICWLKDNSIVDANVVHHIIEIKEDWDKRFDKKNLICLCDSCHSKTHVEYRKGEDSKRAMQGILFNLFEEWDI